MKNIYILFISLVLVACGNSEKNNETASEEQLNTNEIVVTTSQFESEHMELGKLEEHAFNQSV